MVRMHVLVTGAAGFIGSHVSAALMRQGYRVVGVDNFNDYYSPARKRQNLSEVAGEVPSGAVIRPSRVIASDTGRSSAVSKRRSREVSMPTSIPASSTTGKPLME